LLRIPTRISDNKAQVRVFYFSICGIAVLLLLLLAGRGGEGRLNCSTVAFRSGGGLGFSYVRVHHHGTGHSSTRLCLLILRRKETKFVFEAGALNK
jgi:hypothetical protein